MSYREWARDAGRRTAHFGLMTKHGFVAACGEDLDTPIPLSSTPERDVMCETCSYRSGAVPTTDSEHDRYLRDLMGMNA